MEIDLEKEALRLRLIRCLDAACLLRENNYISNETLNIIKANISYNAMCNNINPESLEAIDGDDREDADREFD